MTQPYANMIPEIRHMRDTVASLARADTDKISYGAYLLQARSLKLMEEKVTSLRYDANARAEREHLNEPQFCEQYYLEMLSVWLRNHIDGTTARKEGGEVDLVNAKSMKPDELKIARLHASRHGDMVGEFCERYASEFSKWAGEIEADEMAFKQMHFETSNSPRL